MAESHVIRAVLFDLDGTLMQTALDMHFVLNQLFARDHHPLVSLQETEQNASNGLNAMLKLRYTLDEHSKAFHALRAYFLHHYAQRLKLACMTPLYSGIRPLLYMLQQHNIVWGIVTNKPKSLAQQLLVHHRLSTFCAVLICPEDVQHKKPNPEPLFKACRILNVAPNQCIYIGDHLRDIQAGQHAKMATIAALYGYLESCVNPQQWHATFMAHTPMEILRWLYNNRWNICHRYE